MTTGYQSSVVAEARQRLQDILRGIDGVLKIQKQAKEQEQYNFDPSPLYAAARHDVIALAADFDIFKKFIDENREKLYEVGNSSEVSYYAYKIDNIEMQIDNLENTIVIPSLTTPIATGSTENDTDVGKSFTGRVLSAPDGDTLMIRQFADGEGVPRDYTVRIAGIEAIESGAECGQHVALLVDDFWRDKDVTVYYDRHTPNDLYGRVLGTVYWNDTNFAIWSLNQCYSAPNLKFGKNHFVDPDEIKQAFANCVSACPLSGSIKITTLPTHAVVRYGKIGESLTLAAELTPCEIILPVGKYRIALSAAGCGTVLDDIVVTQYKQQLPVYSLPKYPVVTGTVRVEVAPVGKSIVSVDGEVIGLAPLSFDRPVDVPVSVSVATEGYDVFTDNIVPNIGEVKNVVVIPQKS